jgi:hypothetical protein
MIAFLKTTAFMIVFFVVVPMVIMKYVLAYTFFYDEPSVFNYLLSLLIESIVILIGTAAHEIFK